MNKKTKKWLFSSVSPTFIKVFKIAIAVVVVIFALSMIYFEGKSIAEKKELIKHGLPAYAKINDSHARLGGTIYPSTIRYHIYRITYTFTPQESNIQRSYTQKDLGVSQDTYYKYKDAYTLPIRYLPENPAISIPSAELVSLSPTANLLIATVLSVLIIWLVMNFLSKTFKFRWNAFPAGTPLRAWMVLSRGVIILSGIAIGFIVASPLSALLAKIIFAD